MGHRFGDGIGRGGVITCACRTALHTSSKSNFRYCDNTSTNSDLSLGRFSSQKDVSSLGLQIPKPCFSASSDFAFLSIFFCSAANFCSCRSLAFASRSRFFIWAGVSSLAFSLSSSTSSASPSSSASSPPPSIEAVSSSSDISSRSTPSSSSSSLTRSRLSSSCRAAR